MVRAELLVGGAVIRTQPSPMGESESCAVVRVSDLDPKLGDNVPMWARTKVNEMICGLLSTNLFRLLTIIARDSEEIAAYAVAGPLVNWNGAVAAPERPRDAAGEEKLPIAPARRGDLGIAASHVCAFFAGVALGAATRVYC